MFTLRKEVDTYLLANNDKASEDNLYVVWIGANNYLGMPDEVEANFELMLMQELLVVWNVWQKKVQACFSI